MRTALKTQNDRAKLIKALIALKPLSLWALDETSGTVARDQGSLANSGTYTNTPTLAQDSLLPNGYGKSAYFNGTLGAGSRPYVAVATNAGYDTGTFTIVALVKPSTIINGAPVVNWRDAGNNDGWTLQQNATGFVFFVWDTAFRNTTQVAAADGSTYLLIGRVTGSAVKLALTNLTTGVTASEGSAACGNMTAPGTSPVVRIGLECHISAGSALGINGNVQLVTWIGSAITDIQVAELQRLAK